jgi:hypothetical protein
MMMREEKRNQGTNLFQFPFPMLLKERENPELIKAKMLRCVIKSTILREGKMLVVKQVMTAMRMRLSVPVDEKSMPNDRPR